MSTGSGGDAVQLIVGLLIANVSYLLGTAVIAHVYGVAPEQLFGGPFSNIASSMISTWVAIGGLLGITDVLAVLGFIGQLSK